VTQNGSAGNDLSFLAGFGLAALGHGRVPVKLLSLVAHLLVNAIGKLRYTTESSLCGTLGYWSLLTLIRQDFP